MSLENIMFAKEEDSIFLDKNRRNKIGDLKMEKRMIIIRQKIRKRKLQDIKTRRLVEGFYYTYLAEPGEIGDRSKGWLMMAVDHVP